MDGGEVDGGGEGFAGGEGSEGFGGNVGHQVGFHDAGEGDRGAVFKDCNLLDGVFIEEGTVVEEGECLISGVGEGGGDFGVTDLGEVDGEGTVPTLKDWHAERTSHDGGNDRGTESLVNHLGYFCDVEKRTGRSEIEIREIREPKLGLEVRSVRGKKRLMNKTKRNNRVKCQAIYLSRSLCLMQSYIVICSTTYVYNAPAMHSVQCGGLCWKGKKKGPSSQGNRNN